MLRIWEGFLDPGEKTVDVGVVLALGAVSQGDAAAQSNHLDRLACTAENQQAMDS